MSLLKSNFPTKELKPDEAKPLDATEAFLQKAKESIGGSMVFTERKLKYWDGADDDGQVSGTPSADQ